MKLFVTLPLTLFFLKDVIAPYNPTRTLPSQNAGLLAISRVSDTSMRSRGFSFQTSLSWNQLPVCV